MRRPLTNALHTAVSYSAVLMLQPHLSLTVACKLQRQLGTLSRVGNRHATMGGHYGKGRRWRVEDRHRFYTNQLYPHDVDSATGYKDQFKQVSAMRKCWTEADAVHSGSAVGLQSQLTSEEQS